MLAKTKSIKTPHHDPARAQARQTAESVATPGDWLTIAMGQHDQIEAAFAAVQISADSAACGLAQQQLKRLLTAHAIAEELVLYPALVKAHREDYAAEAYSDQASVKIHLSLLEDLIPRSSKHAEAVEQLRVVVSEHLRQEEGKWFITLRTALPEADQLMLAPRYRDEFQRYFTSTPE